MGLNVFPALLLLAMAALVAMISRRIRVPYTVGLTLCGVLLAFSGVRIPIELSKNLVFSIFLPPLLFEAALLIEWRPLRKDFLSIGLLATVGLVMSVVLMTLGLRYALPWELQPALLLAILLSATDPVAVISTLKDAKITGRVRLLVEAESLFNDGTAAVLYTLALAGLALTPQGIGLAAGQLALNVLGGVVIGLLIGASASFLAKRADDYLVEITFSLYAAYSSFLLAEAFHVSGVLATVSAGIWLANQKNSRGTIDPHKEQLLVFWEFIAFAANSLIFLLIGMHVGRDFSLRQLPLIGLVILLSLSGRALCVYVTLLPLNKRRTAVTIPQQHVLFWGGLRGALALALALGLPESMPHRREVIDVTFGVVTFSVIVQGITFMPLLKKLGLCNPTLP